MYQYIQRNQGASTHQRFSSDNNLCVSRYQYGYSDSQPMGNFTTNSYDLILIIKGQALLSVEADDIQIKTRDILFIFPQSRYVLKEKDGLGYIKITFDQHYLRTQGISLSSEHSYQLFRSNLVDKFSLSKEEFDDIRSNMSALEKKLKISSDVPYKKDIIRNSFTEIVYDLFLIKNKRAAYEPFKQDTKVKITSRFLKLLSEKFLEEKRVNYYASALCVSPRHLSHVVKLTTDKTARELVDEVVIKEAKLLLQSPNLNISEVALKLRFADASFFGKYFKKQTGLSPSDYKFSAVMPV